MDLILNPNKQPDSHIYLTLAPHPEVPITNDTFDELDQLIREVNDSLGIKPVTGRTVYMPQVPGIPTSPKYLSAVMKAPIIHVSCISIGLALLMSGH